MNQDLELKQQIKAIIAIKLFQS